MDPFILRDGTKRPTNEMRDPRKEFNEQFIKQISNESFREWYNEREFAENIRNGQLYFNSPSPLDDDFRHSPSKLMQCHRKVYYKDQNAPKEGTAPKGLFWVGSRFEEDVIMPYLQSLTTDETYVQNSVWVDTEVDHDEISTPFQVKGSTDPVIVTADAEPRVVTEVKTTSSVEYLDAPRYHHRAQLMAYLFALRKEQDHPLDGLVIYADKTTFKVEVYHVEFDPMYWWLEVVPWMIEQTKYREQEELPPADPPKEWACEYCSFKERCGKGDQSTKNMEPTGFVPGVEYEREAVENHLDAHSDVNLTPLLRSRYPKLEESNHSSE